MPIPSGVEHVIVSGTMPGAERWACGMWLQSAATGSAQDSADTFATSGSGFDTMIKGIMGFNVPEVVARQIDVYVYTGGSGASDHGVAAINIPGTVANGARHPNQIALVTTLRSSLPSGRGRGRIYWPATAVPVDSNGLGGSAVQTIVTLVGQFLLNSNGRVVSQAAGTARPITKVDADRVLDTLNARRRQLPNARVSYTG